MEETRQVPVPEHDPIPDYTPPPHLRTGMAHPPAEPGQKSRKKLFIAVGVTLLLLMAAGAVAYGMFGKKAAAPAPAGTAPAAADTAGRAGDGRSADTIAYAFRELDSKAYRVYWRPAGGGDRTEVMTLDNNVSIALHRTKGSKIAFVVRPAGTSSQPATVWYSPDGGRSFDQAYVLSNPQDDITSIAFSSDTDTLLVAVAQNVSGKNAISEVQLSGSFAAKELYVHDKAGVDLVGYRAANNQLVMMDGCWFCGGRRPSALKRIDLAVPAVTMLKDFGNTQYIVDAAVNTDMSAITVARATVRSQNGMEAEFVSPYSVDVVEVGTGKTDNVASITAPANPNGTSVSYRLDVGYMADGTTPYYSVESRLYTVRGTDPALHYDALSVITGSYFVSDKTVIASAGKDADFTLGNYNIETKDTKNILAGDANTYVLGVGTQ